MKSHKIIKKHQENISESVANHKVSDSEKAAQEAIQKRQESIEYAFQQFAVKYCFKKKKEIEREKQITDEDGQPKTIKEKTIIYPFDYNLLLRVVTNIILMFRKNSDILPNNCDIRLMFDEENRRILLYRTYDRKALVQKSKLQDWYIEHIKDDSLFAADIVKKLILTYLLDPRFPVKLSESEQKRIAYILINKPDLLMELKESVNSSINSANTKDVIPNTEDMKWQSLYYSYKDFCNSDRGRKSQQGFIKACFDTLGTQTILNYLNGSDSDKLCTLLMHNLEYEIQQKGKNLSESVRTNISTATSETMNAQADEIVNIYNDIAEDMLELYADWNQRYPNETFIDSEYDKEITKIWKKFEAKAPVEDKLYLLNNKVWERAMCNGECLMGDMARTICQSKYKPTKRLVSELERMNTY